jgi:predicted Fe-S protein YdhL (DUF1289 family)
MTRSARAVAGLTLEVAHWNEMALPDREVVWQRIDKEATAWRYNRYKDRVK